MAGSRAAAAAARRQLVRTAADTTFSVPARIATRSIATSVATASSRLGRGSRFTLSKDGPHSRRTPRKSTPHGDPHNVPHEAAASTPVSAPSQTHQPAQPSTASTQAEPTQPGASAASAAVATDPSLHVPAVVPDAPQDVLQPSKPEFEGATRLLSQSALVVTREIEMMNIFLGFEQANKYSIHAPSGELVGYLAEEEQGFMTGAMKRQLLRTHRPFRATVMDASGKPVLMIRRPFTWINSTAHIYAVRSDYPIGYGAPQDADLDSFPLSQLLLHFPHRPPVISPPRREAPRPAPAAFLQKVSPVRPNHLLISFLAAAFHRGRDMPASAAPPAQPAAPPPPPPPASPAPPEDVEATAGSPSRASAVGTVNWGTATLVGVFAGLLYGGSREASASVSKDAEVMLKMGSTTDKREQYRLMRDAMEKRFIRVAKGSLVGGVRLGMFTATFFGIQNLLIDTRGVHDVFNIAAAGSATAAAFGLILPGSMMWRARNVLVGSALGAGICYPLGWVQLKLAEKANLEIANSKPSSDLTEGKENQSRVGAAIERLEGSLKK